MQWLPSLVRGRSERQPSVRNTHQAEVELLQDITAPAVDPGIAVGSSLHYQINHIFLPPNPPQTNDNTVKDDMMLMQTVRRSLKEFQSYVKTDDRAEMNRCIRMMEKMISLRDQDGFLISKALKMEIVRLTDEDILVLHIRAQNAGLLITRISSELKFESFELLARNSDVGSCVGRLRRRFPGPAAVIKYHLLTEPTFLDPLIDVIVKLDRDKGNTGGQDFPSTASSPRLVTEMLNGLLRGVGRPADVLRISKNTREEVLCEKNYRGLSSPWHRSALWLLIRVSLQLSISRSACTVKDELETPSLYKCFMIFLTSSLLHHAARQGVSSDRLFVMKAKISRRILKLGRSMITEYEWFRFTEETMNEVQDILTKERETIQARFQDRLDLSALGNLDFDNDAIQTMGKLRPYIDAIDSRPSSEVSESKEVQGVPFRRIKGLTVPEEVFNRFNSREFESDVESYYSNDSDDSDRFYRSRRSRMRMRRAPIKKLRWKARVMEQDEVKFYEIADFQHWVKSILPAQDYGAPDAMVPQTDFQYRHLENPGDIRLLQLHPSSSRSDTLSFSLIHVNLDEDPEYVAISYTRDGQVFDHPAICDGQRVMISRNCDNILRHIRNDKRPFSIWIDQVCIQQASVDDNNRMFGKMAEIFRKSKAVFIWTGDIDDQTLDILSRLSDRHTVVNEYIRTGKPRLGGRKDKEGNEDVSDKRKRFQARENDDVIAQKFNSRTWFSRMWTVQEVALVEHSEIYFLAGNILVNLRHIVTSLMEDLEIKSNFVQVMTVHYFYFFCGLQKKAERQRQQQGAEKGHDMLRLSPYTLLSYLRSRKCFDPRDKVFALWWIIDNIPRYPDGDLALGKPDYDKSVDQVYKEMAAWALKSQGDHRILFMAPLSPSEMSNSSPTTALPSWVPDLARLSRLRRSNSGPMHIRDQENMYFDPSKPHSLDFQVEVHSGLTAIDMLAEICDTVNSVSNEMPLSPDLDDPVKQVTSPRKVSSWQRSVMETLVHFYVHILWPLRDRLDAKEAFRRSIFPSSTREKDRAFDLWYEHFESWVQTCCTPPQQDTVATPLLKLHRPEEQPVKATSEMVSVLDGLDDAYIKFAEEQNHGKMKEAFADISKHCLFSTAEGHIGLVFGTIQRGDVLSIAKGVDRILILRPRGEPDTYSLVGIAFIHEYMKESNWCKGKLNMRKISIV